MSISSHRRRTGRGPIVLAPVRRSAARLAALIASFSAAAFTAGAHAQCAPIDFEDLPLGTVVTTQYPGVSFTGVDSSCGGFTRPVRIIQPTGGTSSGSRALGIDPGCPDFSPGYLQAVFTEGQRVASMSVGSTVFSMEIRAYASVAGGAPFQTVTVPPNAAVRSLVRLGGPGFPDIRRIEWETDNQDFETIDDLEFLIDTTPPEAIIESPDWLQCVCLDDIISVVGSACEPDGDYGSDRLDYRAAGDETGPWTEVGSFTSPLCGGTLYTLPAATLGPGTHLLRLTVENACGLVSTTVTAVRVDASPPGLNIDRPVPGETICGDVDVCGIVTDTCGVEWTLTAIPSAGGPSTLLATGSGADCGLIASFDASDLIPGDFTLRLSATDTCGQSSTFDRSVTVVDGGCGGSGNPDLDGDGDVDFSDLLALLAAWGMP